MNYIILGAGAIGSYYGAMLSKNCNTLLVGRKEHVDAINSQGLKVDESTEKIFKIKATTEIDEIKENTVVFLTTKVIDSRNAILLIKDKVRNDTIIVCLQNGYGIEELVSKVVDCKVLRAVTNQAVIFEEAGRIKISYNGYFKIEKSDESEKIVKDLKQNGLNAEVSQNIMQDVWKKMLVNCVLNPLTAIYGIKNSEVAEHQKEMKDILKEVKLVLDKEGVMFDSEEYEEICKIKFSENLSSMLQDIRNGKKTEIDYINGAIVKLGQKHNILTPVNKEIVEKIHALEKKD